MKYCNEKHGNALIILNYTYEDNMLPTYNPALVILSDVLVKCFSLYVCTYVSLDSK